MLRRLSMLLILCAVPACESPPQPTRPAGKVVTREQFEEYLQDAARMASKNRGQYPTQGKALLELAGRPDRTHKDGDRETWYYERRTRDKVSGKPDQAAIVELEGGTIERVRFE